MSRIDGVEENNVVTGTLAKSRGGKYPRSNILTEDWDHIDQKATDAHYTRAPE
jgi:hypothetical protein